MNKKNPNDNDNDLNDNAKYYCDLLIYSKTLQSNMEFFMNIHSLFYKIRKKILDKN